MGIEQIVSTLRGQIGQTSLSDRTITEYVNLNKPAEGTEPDDAYFTLHSQILKTINGNFSHDVASQVQEQLQVKVNEFKAQWEKDHAQAGQQQQQQQQQQQVQQNNNDEKYAELLRKFEELSNRKPDPDPNVAAMQKSINDLMARLQGEDDKKVVDALVKGIRDKATDLKVQQEPIWNIAVNNVSRDITKDTTAEQVEKLVKAEYESLMKQIYSSGAQPYASADGGGDKSPIQKILEARLAHDKEVDERRQKVLESLK